MFIEGVEYNEESCKLEESTRTGSSEWSVTECVVFATIPHRNVNQLTAVHKFQFHHKTTLVNQIVRCLAKQRKTHTGY